MKNHKGDDYFIDKIMADAEYIISITKDLPVFLQELKKIRNQVND